MGQPRFVEVVDVAAEASSTIAALLASGREFTNPYAWFNVSEFLNATSIDSLRSAFAQYNVTLDSLPDGWRDWATGGLIGAALDVVAPDVPKMPSHARQLILLALAIVVVRELVAHLLARRSLRRFGYSGRHAKKL